MRANRPTSPRALLATPSLILLAVLTLGACGSSGSGDGEARVEIERSRFMPERIEVEVGEPVEFVNLDPFDHTITSAEGSPLTFDSGDLGQDQVFTQTFDAAGTYSYFCRIHPTMRATVVVG